MFIISTYKKVIGNLALTIDQNINELSLITFPLVLNK
jgi:hypothetical protein